MPAEDHTVDDGRPDQVDVTVDLSADIEVAGEIALCVAVADHLDAAESLEVTGADGPVPTRLLALGHGTRIHVVDAPLGRLSVRYTATVRTSSTPERTVDDADRLTFVLPSRYSPSDRLAGWAAGEFGMESSDEARVLRVADWVNTRTAYTSGTTGPTDDALIPMLTGAGVCRDYAHLTAAILRALDIPARYVSVYAPGLDPMDAHAVVEAAVDGVWRVVDSTRLAPRRSMVRIGTGRDAADVALMTTLGARTGMPDFRVVAVAQPELPPEDPGALVSLA